MEVLKVISIVFLYGYVMGLDATVDSNPSTEIENTEPDSKTLDKQSSFGLPLQCANNICTLYLEAGIPFTSITVAGKMVVGYNVVQENTISGESHLIYKNNSTGKSFSIGLRLSIVLEGTDELQIKLEIFCGKDEKSFSVGGGLGSELPSLCAAMPSVPQYFMFCFTIGDFKYFHDDDSFIICFRAEIQFCSYRMVTLVYKCLTFSKRAVENINNKLKKVTTFSRNQYEAAKKTLDKLPTFRKSNLENTDGEID